MSPEERATLRQVFDAVYENFAMDTRQVADKFFGGDIRQAYDACRKLEAMGTKDGCLLAGDQSREGIGYGRGHGKSPVGTKVMWQCWNTYDSSSRADHDAEAKAAGL